MERFDKIFFALTVPNIYYTTPQSFRMHIFTWMRQGRDRREDKISREKQLYLLTRPVNVGTCLYIFRCQKISFEVSLTVSVHVENQQWIMMESIPILLT